MKGNRNEYTFTLTVTVGGIAKKLGVVEDRIEIREYLDRTISIDHDVVDGAPMARFVNHFRELVESGHGLDDYVQGVWYEQETRLFLSSPAQDSGIPVLIICCSTEQDSATFSLTQLPGSLSVYSYIQNGSTHQN